MQEVEIRIGGQIDKSWSTWFSGLSITHNESNETVLTGSVQDQAELRGILSRLADLGLELISVTTKPKGSK
jgi:hypothetical protein